MLSIEYILGSPVFELLRVSQITEEQIVLVDVVIVSSVEELRVHCEFSLEELLNIFSGS